MKADPENCPICGQALHYTELVEWGRHFRLHWTAYVGRPDQGRFRVILEKPWRRLSEIRPIMLRPEEYRGAIPIRCDLCREEMPPPWFDRHMDVHADFNDTYFALLSSVWLQWRRDSQLSPQVFARLAELATKGLVRRRAIIGGWTITEKGQDSSTG